MSELSIAALSAADRLKVEAAQARDAMRSAGIPVIADLPPLTHESAQVAMVRFDGDIPMADVRRAAESIGCNLEGDRHGMKIVRKNTTRPRSSK